MADRQKLLELAEKAEKAEGPDRELDAEIGAAVRYHPYGPDHWIGGSDIEFRALGRRVQAFFGTGESCDDWFPAQYTASLDAALTLVPEQFKRWVQMATAHSGWHVTDLRRYSQIGTDYHEVTGDGLTFALSICAAALRARAAI